MKRSALLIFVPGLNLFQSKYNDEQAKELAKNLKKIMDVDASVES